MDKRKYQKRTRIIIEFSENNKYFKHDFYDMKEAFEAFEEFKNEKITFKTQKKGMILFEDILKKYGYENIKIRKIQICDPSIKWTEIKNRPRFSDIFYSSD
jgi:hypothetical protein